MTTLSRADPLPWVLGVLTVATGWRSRIALVSGRNLSHKNLYGIDYAVARAASSYAFDLLFPAVVFCADFFGAVWRSRLGGAGAAATDA